jgi:hypothetical protein
MTDAPTKLLIEKRIVRQWKFAKKAFPGRAAYQKLLDPTRIENK